MRQKRSILLSVELSHSGRLAVETDWYYVNNILNIAVIIIFERSHKLRKQQGGRVVVQRAPL